MWGGPHNNSTNVESREVVHAQYYRPVAETNSLDIGNMHIIFHYCMTFVGYGVITLILTLLAHHIVNITLK